MNLGPHQRRERVVVTLPGPSNELLLQIRHPLIDLALSPGMALLASDPLRNVPPQDGGIVDVRWIEGDSDAHLQRVPCRVRSVVIVKTASGSTYVLSVSDPGVHWCRLPAPDRRFSWAASGWEDVMPRIVPGERLLIGDLRTTPITDVSVLPA